MIAECHKKYPYQLICSPFGVSNPFHTKNLQEKIFLRNTSFLPLSKKQIYELSMLCMLPPVSAVEPVDRLCLAYSA
jgi:hypothetical protein